MASKYEATGQAHFAFATTGPRIDYGVNALGNWCGVFGSSLSTLGRETAYGGVGVWGEGGAEGIHGKATFIDKDGQLEGGRGGVFEGMVAQIRLIPSPQVSDSTAAGRFIGTSLPAQGKSGDLFALSDGLGASLWFCSRGTFKDADGSVVGALWSRLELGQAVTGKRTF